jgi:hypothetical protein
MADPHQKALSQAAPCTKNSWHHDNQGASQGIQLPFSPRGFPRSVYLRCYFIALKYKNKMGYSHYKTPKKARVQGAYNFALHQKRVYGIPFFKADIFRANNVSYYRSYKILDDCQRTFDNNPFINKTRSQKKILIKEDVDKIEKVI